MCLQLGVVDVTWIDLHTKKQNWKNNIYEKNFKKSTEKRDIRNYTNNIKTLIY